MASSFNNCFELSCNNNTDESLASVVAEIAFKVAVMTSSGAKVSFLWLRSLLKCLCSRLPWLRSVL